MKSIQITILIFILVGLNSCDSKSQEVLEKASKTEKTALSVDHFNLWVKDPQKAKDKLSAAGFKSVPDSLSMVHLGQGTTGKYFYFLNCYFEFIYVYDSTEFIENCIRNPNLDFNERLNFETNQASPFGVALRVRDYAVDKIPFESIKYHQDWMQDGASIYAAKNSKLKLFEPSVFVVYPEIQSDNFEKMEDLMKIPEEYKLWRSFFKHPNGAELVTMLEISSPKYDSTSESIKALNSIEILRIKKGPEHLMEIYFDKNKQEKSIDLRPDLPMKVYY